MVECKESPLTNPSDSAAVKDVSVLWNAVLDLPKWLHESISKDTSKLSKAFFR